MKQISKYIKVVNGTLLAGGLLLTACTSHFESWNINPNEVTIKAVCLRKLRC